jgi:hypothetical protein
MSWRLFSFGIALAAVFTAYQRADFAIPLSTHSAALSLRDFWHRTFMQYAFWQPYVLSEQSHVTQHPPPTDALSPALAKAAREAAQLKPEKQERMPVFFISHGTPEALYQEDSLPYKSWQSIGRQIVDLNPTAIVAVSSHWEGEDDDIYVNSMDSENELLCMSYRRPTKVQYIPYLMPSSLLLSHALTVPCRRLQGLSATVLPGDFLELRLERDLHDSYQRVAQAKDPSYTETTWTRFVSIVGLCDADKADVDPISGLWIPMKAMFNGSTSIPIIQLSLFNTGNSKRAIKLGSALRSLRSVCCLGLSS